MSAAQVLEQIEKLPFSEQREVFEQLRDKFEESDDELTPEQKAELDRRAEEALKHPGRGTPIEEVVAKIERRFAERLKNPACAGKSKE